jgi:hypothetical protein
LAIGSNSFNSGSSWLYGGPGTCDGAYAVVCVCYSA